MASVDIALHADPALAGAVRDLAWEGYEGPGEARYGSREEYQWLAHAGSRLWLDTGDASAAEKMWSAEMEALTTNNTLVNQVVQTGVMDELIGDAAGRIRQDWPGITDRDLVVEIAFLVNAKLALSLVHNFRAHVSVEVHPDLGFDVDATVVFARRYYQISPDFFYIKVPLTPDGFVATRKLSREGIPVNYTLGFSARQNYLAARFSRPAFVNVFLGRLNAVVEENALGSPANVGEKAALASCEAVRDLRATHVDIPTSQIAASMRSGPQVLTLAGVDVLTIPPKVAGEYLQMDVRREDVRRVHSDELQVNLDAGSGLNTLWEIDERFVDFTDDAAERADTMDRGRDLVELAREHGVGLFREWTTQERSRIRETGKIPDLSHWPGAPIDDVMSMSALESFAKDQVALDGRIQELIFAGRVEQIGHDPSI